MESRFSEAAFFVELVKIGQRPGLRERCFFSTACPLFVV